MKNEFGFYSVYDAKKFGITKAVILGRIKFWCEYNEKHQKNFHKKKYWSGYLSAKQLSEQTGIPQKTIVNNVNSLVDSKIILKDSFNKKGFDKTCWYTINTEIGFKEDLNEEQSMSETDITYTQNGDTEYSSRVNDIPELGIPSIPEMGIPIPYKPINHSENKTANKSGPNTRPKEKFQIEDPSIFNVSKDIFNEDISTDCSDNGSNSNLNNNSSNLTSALEQETTVGSNIPTIAEQTGPITKSSKISSTINSPARDQNMDPMRENKYLDFSYRDLDSMDIKDIPDEEKGMYWEAYIHKDKLRYAI